MSVWDQIQQRINTMSDEDIFHHRVPQSVLRRIPLLKPLSDDEMMDFQINCHHVPCAVYKHMRTLLSPHAIYDHDSRWTDNVWGLYRDYHEHEDDLNELDVLTWMTKQVSEVGVDHNFLNVPILRTMRCMKDDKSVIGDMLQQHCPQWSAYKSSL